MTLSKKSLSPEDTRTAIRREREKLQFVYNSFYQAFRRGNWALMQSLWANSEGVSTIHPGCPQISGYEDVMRSWKNILQDPPNIETFETELSLFGNFALITCVEAVNDYLLSAANGLVLDKGNWRFYYHHSSLIMMEFSEDEDADVDEDEGEFQLH